MDTEMSAKAVAVLKALAHRAADGKSTTIAHDWGFGSATVIDESGTHTHCGGDWYERDDAALKAFINGMHSILCVGAGLSWVGPNVLANRHFAVGQVWARLLEPKLGPPQSVRLSDQLGRAAWFA